MHTGNMTKTAARKPKVIETRLTLTPVIAVSADATPLFMGGRKTGWWTKSLYLSPNHLKHLNIAQSDREQLRALLNIRLGVDTLSETKLNLNTNKNEAANRGHCQRTSARVGRCRAQIKLWNWGVTVSQIRTGELTSC